MPTHPKTLTGTIHFSFSLRQPQERIGLISFNMSSNICIPWLSPQYCSSEQVAAMQIQNIIFLILLVVAGTFFLISTLRRWYLLREPLNTFAAMAVGGNLWLPCAGMYYGLWLAMNQGKSVPLPLASFGMWWGVTLLVSTFGPLIAAWLQLTSKRRLTSRKLRADWPLPLVLTVVGFVLIHTVTTVLMGFPQYYNIAARVYFATWTAYLWACSFLLFYGARRIKNHMKTLASPKKGTSSKEGPPEAEDEAVRRVKASLNRVLIVVILFMVIPGSVGTILHCTALAFIDSHAWAIGTVLALYRICQTGFLIFWGATFWVETSYRVESGNSSQATNSTNSAKLSGEHTSCTL